MNKRNIIIVSVTLIVIFIIYQALSGSSTTSSSSLTTDTQSADSADAKYIYSLLQQMQQVKLDDSIFASQVFQNLKDNTVSFSPQAVGRPNPFAPIGIDIQGTTTSATTTGH